MKNKIRSLQSYREAKLRKKRKRLNKMLRDKYRQLLRSKLVRAIIAFFKMLADWLPRSSPPPAAPPVAEAKVA